MKNSTGTHYRHLSLDKHVMANTIKTHVNNSESSVLLGPSLNFITLLTLRDYVNTG